MRVQYIDSLKGFAILIVVIGHVCEFGLGQNMLLFNQFYYSFHMPLFMFLSGLVAYRHEFGWFDLKLFFAQKFVRLIVPFFSVGLFCTWLQDGSFCSFIKSDVKNGYWFLFTLFFLYSLTVVPNLISAKLKNRFSIWIDVGLYGLVYIACIFILKFYLIDHVLFESIMSYRMLVKLYPFFVFGILISKHIEFENLIDKGASQTLAIVAYVVAFIFLLRTEKPISCAGVFAIIVLYHYFKYQSEKWGMINRALIYLGKRSLEIYILHYFFIPSIPDVGTYLASNYYRFIFNNNAVLFFVLSSLIAGIVILCSIAVASIIGQSKLLSFVILGKSYNLKNTYHQLIGKK